MGVLSRIKRSNDAKALIKNFISLSLIKVLGFITPLIVLPYLTKTIGADNYGLIAFAAAVIVFFETTTDWGFGYTGTRDVAQCREDLKKASEIYSEVVFGRILLMCVCFIILCILILTIPVMRDNWLLLLFTFLYIPGSTLCQEWVFQAFEQMKYLTIMSVLSKLVVTLFVFVAIRKADDYVFYPLVMAAGYLASGIYSQIFARKKLGLRLSFQPIRNIIIRVKNSINMFLTLIFPNLYTNFTTILLKNVGGDYATAIYAGGSQLQKIIDQLTNILSRTFFPFLSRHKEKHHLYVLISGTIAIIASLIMFFGADIFVKILLAPEFKEAATVMKIFSPAPFFLFLMNTYGTNYLVIIGKESILRNIIILCSLFGFALTWLMTTKFGYIGATITVVSVWGIRGFATYYFAKKEKNQ